MLKYYFRGNKVYFRPSSIEYADDLRALVQFLKAHELSAIDIDYEPMNYTGSAHDDMDKRGQRDQRYDPSRDPRHYQQHQDPYGRGEQSHYVMPGFDPWGRPLVNPYGPMLHPMWYHGGRNPGYGGGYEGQPYRGGQDYDDQQYGERAPQQNRPGGRSQQSRDRDESGGEVRQTGSKPSSTAQ